MLGYRYPHLPVDYLWDNSVNKLLNYHRKGLRRFTELGIATSENIFSLDTGLQYLQVQFASPYQDVYY